MHHAIDIKTKCMMFQSEMKYFETAISWVQPVIERIITVWTKIIGPAKAAILSFVAIKTLGQGRGAEEFKTGDFIEGLGLSERSIRDSVASLCDENLLDIYEVEGVRKTNSGSVRVFAINFKMLFEGKHPANFAGVAHRYIHRYFVPSLLLDGLDKSSHSRGLRTAIGTGGKNNPEKVAMPLAIPKRTRTPRPPADAPIADVIAKTLGRSMATRVQRADSATTKPTAQLTVAETQALLDIATKDYGVPRMVVTQRGFKTFKDRVATHQIEDIRDFLRFVVSNWLSIATKSHAAYRKAEVKRGSPLPEAPNFMALAYRLPYFASIYNDRLANKIAKVVGMSAEEAEIAKLKKAVVQLTNDNHKLLARPVPTSFPPQPRRATIQAPASKQPYKPRTDDSDLDDVEIPTWQEHEDAAQRRKG